MKIFFALILILFFTTSHAQNKIRFGVYAYKGYEDTKKRYAPLVEHLNEVLEKEVVLEILSQSEMDEKVAKGELDIVTTSPIHFLAIRYGQKVSGAIATLDALYDNGEHSNKFAGVIIVKKESPIKKLEDLKDKTIAVPNINLLGGFRSQAYELYKKDIDIVKSAKSITELNLGYKNVIKNVLDGKYEVGFSRDGIVEQMIKDGEIKPDDLRIINAQKHSNYPFITSTPLYPEWPVFALSHVDEGTIKEFVSALFSLKPTSRHAQESKIYGYTLPVDYLPTEHLTRELRMPPFDKTPQIKLMDIWNSYKYDLIVLVLAMFLTIVYYTKAQKKQQLMESLFKNMGEGVYGIDKNGDCVWINDKALNMLGFSKDEVLHKNQHEIFHYKKTSNEAYSVSECPAYLTLKDGLSREVEDHFIRKDGLFFSVSLNIAPTDDGGAIIVFRDTTIQKAYEETIKKEKEKAQMADKAKSEFLANMSHEIRTPMNAIIGLSQIMLDTKLDEKQKNLVLKVGASSKMLLGIINDILDYSKIDAGKLELEQKSFDLVNVLMQLDAMFSQNAQNKNVELLLKISNDAPTVAIGDELRVTQVLTNLLSNALKFTHSGEVSLNVELKERLSDDMAIVAFSISDSGIGMSEEQLKKLFSPFTQADSSTTRKYGGTGLGLTISKRIVEAMGSTLRVKSKEGVGSDFCFDLELKVESWDKTKYIKKEAEKEQKLDFRGIKTLVVEDNEINQEVVSMMLKRVGISVEVANNGEEGVLKFLKSPQGYSMIFMDLHMPVMNGFEAAKMIRESDAQIPIVALSAATMVEDRQRVLACGMNEHLSKPIELNKLYEIVAKFCHVKIETEKEAPQKDETLVFNIEYAIKNFKSQEVVKKFLGKFLEQLRSDFKDVAKELSNNSEASRMQIHSLKGVSGNLGIDELHHICKNIDLELKLKKRVLAVDIEALKIAIAKTEDEISKFLTEETSVQNKKKLTKDELESLVSEIKAKLMDYGVVDEQKSKLFYENIKDVVSPKEKLELFMDAVNEFEHEKALEILETLTKSAPNAPQK